jgi:hypothetical protein
MRSDIRPVLIGPKNAEAMAGVSWRWIRDHAADLGVEVIHVGGKSFVGADALLDAVARRVTTKAVETEVDDLAAFRARIAGAK